MIDHTKQLHTSAFMRYRCSNTHNQMLCGRCIRIHSL